MYLCDDARHLICSPYSVENLHKMAEDLKIKRCWFHKDHYDIPKRRIVEIIAKCEVVTSRRIVETIMTYEQFVEKYGMSPSLIPVMDERQLKEFINVKCVEERMIQWKADVIEYYKIPDARMILIRYIHG